MLGFIQNGSQADQGVPQVGSVIIFFIQELIISCLQFDNMSQLKLSCRPSLRPQLEWLEDWGGIV